MATRRAFLAGLAAATLPRLGWADAGNPAYVAAAKESEAYLLHGLSAAGDSLFRLALPGRGHAACVHPAQPLAVAFARRPGTFALILNCVTGQETARLTPPEGRQFNGHGVFSADGARLMTSEVVADGSAGRIGVWETQGWRRIGEWDSGGIGPHDLKRLADGRLVVANGGIATDPKDRTKLNIATMRPNLTLLSTEGVLLDQLELPAELHQNSIRHLALSADTVAFAMQWEGEPTVAVPLLGLWTPGTAPRLCEAAGAEAFTMQGYAGSIAFDDTAARVAITSPRGGAVMVFAADGVPLATHRRADLCGIAPATGGFALSDGQGALWRLAGAGLEPLARHDGTGFDNHLIALA